MTRVGFPTLDRDGHRDDVGGGSCVVGAPWMTALPPALTPTFNARDILPDNTPPCPYLVDFGLMSMVPDLVGQFRAVHN